MNKLQLEAIIKQIKKYKDGENVNLSLLKLNLQQLIEEIDVKAKY